MVKTAAERQASYRASRAFSGKDGEGQRRVNVWLSTGSVLALKRIARRQGVTQQTLIENLLFAEDERILDEIPVDSAEWNKYFGINTL
jgi:predicted DNA binding CopG/RHH family protein